MKYSLLVGLICVAPAARAQTQAGQGAYAAVAEVVRILEADSTTDWSKVNLEALRQHLIDMNAVTLSSLVAQTSVAGGARFDVTGEGRTGSAIRRMLTAHASVLDRLPAYRSQVVEIPGGVRLTVVARKAGDGSTEARIRGMGFIGLLTVDAHHTTHHLALARGHGMDHNH